MNKTKKTNISVSLTQALSFLCAMILSLMSCEDVSSSTTSTVHSTYQEEENRNVENTVRIMRISQGGIATVEIAYPNGVIAIVFTFREARHILERPEFIAEAGAKQKWKKIYDDIPILLRGTAKPGDSARLIHVVKIRRYADGQVIREVTEVWVESTMDDDIPRAIEVEE